MEDNTKFEIDPELLASFVDEAEEGLEVLDSLFVKIESNPTNLDTVNAIFRPIHTVKGNSAFFGLMKVKQLAHEMESLLTLAKQEKLILTPSIINVLLKGLDHLKKMLSNARNNQPEVTDEQAFNDLIREVVVAKEDKADVSELWSQLFEKFEKAKSEFSDLDSSSTLLLEDIISMAAHLRPGKLSTEVVSEKQTQERSVESKQISSADKTSSVEVRKTMRVAEDAIDNFLDYVGELIVVGEMYNYLHRNISQSGSEVDVVSSLRRINETFDELSDKLQSSIMEIRKVPIRTILQKAPRMVRDIATVSGKDIKVELVGQEIEIDKRLIETLDAPLTHMVRNAADHGIEMPDERIAAGKPRAGTIRITVSETPDDCTLTISDDGRGLNLDAIKAKAVNLGLIIPNQELTQEQTINMIFTSGVSTASKVTDVSGRGVGMDVVKHNIDDANGKIIINTIPNKGSEFIIRVPKTVSTQIIEGFLVGLAGNCYVIPLDKIREVFRPGEQEISSVIGKGQCVNRHNELLSIIRLSEILNCTGTSDNIDDAGIMVSLNIKGGKVALCVEQVLGVQKVVLKEVEGMEFDTQLYSAAAVMGDGTIAMVLNIDLLNQMTTRMSEFSMS